MRLGAPVFREWNTPAEWAQAVDRKRFAVHLDEVCPGDGALDYRTYLEELSRLDPDKSGVFWAL